jgi:predicted nucleic acid-binding protein
VPTFVPDSNCLIAVMSAWHEHHGAATAEIDRRLDARETMALAAPALVEAYAVLTRLPAPHRLSAADAMQLLDTNFVRHGTVIALDAARYLDVLRALVEHRIAGGRSYDAVIAACAEHAGADVLITFDEHDFTGLTGPGLAIVVPRR